MNIFDLYLDNIMLITSRHIVDTAKIQRLSALGSRSRQMSHKPNDELLEHSQVRLVSEILHKRSSGSSVQILSNSHIGLALRLYVTLFWYWNDMRCLCQCFIVFWCILANSLQIMIPSSSKFDLLVTSHGHPPMLPPVCWAQLQGSPRTGPVTKKTREKITDQVRITCLNSVVLTKFQFYVGQNNCFDLIKNSCFQKETTLRLIHFSPSCKISASMVVSAPPVSMATDISLNGLNWSYLEVSWSILK